MYCLGKDSTHQSVSVLRWDTRSKEETARCQCPGFGLIQPEVLQGESQLVVCTCFSAEPLYEAARDAARQAAWCWDTSRPSKVKLRAGAGAGREGAVDSLLKDQGRGQQVGFSCA